MTDVVEIAKERRDALAAEIGTLDDFIRMGESLLTHSRLASNKASGTEDAKAAEFTGPTVVRQYSASTDGNGAEAEHEDLSVRELEAGERVHQSHTILIESASDRQRGLGLFRRGPT